MPGQARRDMLQVSLFKIENLVFATLTQAGMTEELRFCMINLTLLQG